MLMLTLMMMGVMMVINIRIVRIILMLLLLLLAHISDTKISFLNRATIVATRAISLFI
jgi:hypothetical protein